MRPEQMQWWQKAVFYQINPKTFCDSDGNGIGDIQGIISKLSYLNDLGIDVICLGPVYRASWKTTIGPAGVGETLIEESPEDFCEIDPVFGTMDDFERLIYEAGRFRIKVVMDMILPDHSPSAYAANKEILRFWLEHGAAGFRLDIDSILWRRTIWDRFMHRINRYPNRPGMHRLIKEYRKLIDMYNGVLIGETAGMHMTSARRLSYSTRRELHMVYVSGTLNTNRTQNGGLGRKLRRKNFIDDLAKWQSGIPWAAISFENVNQPRCISSFGDGSSKSGVCLATLMLTLRGTPWLYQGQERGEQNQAFWSIDEISDEETRALYKRLSHFLPKRKAFRIVRDVSGEHARVMINWETLDEEVFRRYKELIRMRRQDEDFLCGDFEFLKNTEQYTVYRRGKSMVRLNHGRRTTHGLAPWETQILKP